MPASLPLGTKTGSTSTTPKWSRRSQRNRVWSSSVFDAISTTPPFSTRWHLTTGTLLPLTACAEPPPSCFLMEPQRTFDSRRRPAAPVRCSCSTAYWQSRRMSPACSRSSAPRDPQRINSSLPRGVDAAVRKVFVRDSGLTGGSSVESVAGRSSWFERDQWRGARRRAWHAGRLHRAAGGGERRLANVADDRDTPAAVRPAPHQWCSQGPHKADGRRDDETTRSVTALVRFLGRNDPPGCGRSAECAAVQPQAGRQACLLRRAHQQRDRRTPRPA